MEIQTAFTTIRKYQFAAVCECCRDDVLSETFIIERPHDKQLTPPENGEIRRRQKDFSEHLIQRGWSVKPLICKKCCDNLVLDRVGSAFKDALEVKGGASR